MRFPVFFAAGAAVLLGLASAMPAPQDDEDKPMPVSKRFLLRSLHLGSSETPWFEYNLYNTLRGGDQ